MSPADPGDRDPFAMFDAAYVLGALSPEDREAYEEHLPGCPSCSRAVQELAGLPGLLGQAGPEVMSIEAPPLGLLPSALGRVRRMRRRRVVTTAGAVTVAAAACVTLAFVGVTDTPAEPAGGVAMTVLGAYPVRASAVIAEVATGSRVDMACSYRGGRAGDYVLVAVQRDGGVDQLATWRALPENTARISVGTALRRGDIRALEVRTPGGAPLLRLTP